MSRRIVGSVAGLLVLLFGVTLLLFIVITAMRIAWKIIAWAWQPM